MDALNSNLNHHKKIVIVDGMPTLIDAIVNNELHWSRPKPDVVSVNIDAECKLKPQ